ncbi:hypothetical protein JVT61DRAFT_4646 [Boletus reticuloceps]|uniref:G domain-containing protein n=1 Tax=Boletus reticuloceps TaxID=495285 RepID=A0A8I3A701_9AGAM|nr:hypothetical protein JVT61DRAFT_4646 [Boletus reticuloceps]
MEATRNIVLFGECGVGKSSIINAIVGQSVAKTSNDVLGCTDENASYSVTLRLDTEIKINLWDTIGLDEGTAGRIPADQAKQRLKLFLQRRIEAPEGVDLLLYCIRGASGMKRLPLKRGHWDKYQFVFEEVCKKRVPIALIVTHLESYDPGGVMDAWWDHNEEKISEFGFQFCAHACITILPPEFWDTNIGDINRIEVSRRRLQDIFSRNYLAPRNVLLFGDREDRNDFIDMMVASRTKQNSQAECVSPFTRIPIAFDIHTHVNLWDTRFDDTDDDTFITEKNLKHLVHGIKQAAGIDLLLFCFRAGRPKIRHVRNYNLFHAAICRKKVPVAIVVLGPEEGADTWWQRNESHLRRKGFRFDRHIYIPCNPCEPPRGDLDDATRHQLIRLLQEEYTLGSWKIGDDAFWVTVPNVRAVVGELSWPTTTVVVCDKTRQGAFVDIVPDVQSSLQRSVTSVSPRREHRFQQVDPHNFSLIASQSSGKTQPRISDQSNKVIGLIMFFVSAEEPDSETWRALERFHSVYKGGITPFIVIVHGVSERKLAEDFWRAAPHHIKRGIGAYLTYHPGPNACPEAQAVAQEIMVDMILDRCLVDLGEKVGILREILSVWRKYRSKRNIGQLGGSAR